MEIIKNDSSIRDALVLMDKLGIGLVIVADNDEKVIGILTDGDIRRALLDGVRLEDSMSPFVNRTFFSVTPKVGRAEALDLLKSLHLRQIPIISDNGLLVGVHTFERLLGGIRRENCAVIMAGGEGQRLRPLTEKLPKPMIPIAGRPVLERIILHLISHGIVRIFISVNYLAEMITDYFKDGKNLGCSIEYIFENIPLGSGGALSLLPKQEKPVVVMNGDLITDADIGNLIDFHEASSAYCTIGLKDHSVQIPYGCIETGDDGKVIAIEEKPLIHKKINAGIYVLSPKAISSIPPNTFYPITRLFEEAIGAGSCLYAKNVGSEWIDIGQYSDLKRAKGEL